MKVTLFAITLGTLVNFSTIASEIKNESVVRTDSELFDQYTEISTAIKNARWKYIGCANTTSACEEKASAMGYAESNLAYLPCTPRSVSYSCYAR